ncbi:MAG TPA: porin family protein [Saprospiraceae bacterium]|nr:porin family protein [Saprospiraceae bacterium]
MKYSVFFVIAFSFLHHSLHAQVNSLGPTAGFNYAWMNNRDNTSGRPGFNVGLTYTYSIFEKGGLGVDLRYSEEGMRLEQGNKTYTSELNYLRLPFKFHYFFNELEDDFRPKIYAGPSLGFLVGGDTEIASFEGLTTTVDSRDLFEKFDMGLVAGAGFNYRIASSTWLNFDVAYTHGLVDLPKNGSASYNRNINVNLGVAWGF